MVSAQNLTLPCLAPILTADALIPSGRSSLLCKWITVPIMQGGRWKSWGQSGCSPAGPGPRSVLTADPAGPQPAMVNGDPAPS